MVTSAVQHGMVWVDCMYISVIAIATEKKFFVIGMHDGILPVNTILP